MTRPTTYEVRGPYISRGCPQWYVWERAYLQISQIISTHDTEAEALQSAEELRKEVS